MDIIKGQGVKSPVSPTASPTASPILSDGSVGGAVDLRIEGLGKETLRAVANPEYSPHAPEYPRISKFNLERKDDDGDYLPGQPRISMSALPPSTDKDQPSYLLKYLRDCHLTTQLDGLMPFMKYVFVQTPDHKHIFPLHHQAAHAREVIVNEQPGLHLVWYYDRIFVKPIPTYFLSADFWAYLKGVDKNVYKAAIGFMRSYHRLIRFELDYDMACKIKLIPRNHDLPLTTRDHGCGEEYPTYAKFCRFIEQFADIKDDDVCERYNYGELRLTRINHATLLRKGHLAYFHIYPQWGSYLRQLFAPIILVLGGASVIMGSMQVNLNAQEMLMSTGNWEDFVKASLYFSAFTIILIAGVVGLLMAGSLGMAVHDFFRARGIRDEKRRGITDHGRRSHGMI